MPCPSLLLDDDDTLWFWSVATEASSWFDAWLQTYSLGVESVVMLDLNRSAALLILDCNRNEGFFLNLSN